MKKFGLAVVIVVAIVSISAANAAEYTTVGLGVHFREDFLSLSVEAITQRNSGLRAGGASGFIYATSDDFVGIEVSELAFTLSGLIGYNFGPVFVDLGLGVGVGAIIAEESSTWHPGNHRPFFYAGDSIATVLYFGLSPRIGTHIEAGRRLAIIPSLSMGIDWAWLSVERHAMRSFSSEITSQAGIGAFYDVIRSMDIRLFTLSLNPNVVFLFNRFYLSAGLSFPFSITQEIELSGMPPFNMTTSQNIDGDLSFRFGVGARF